ncbi:MAG: FAD-dependent monooxygenase [Chloroflexi bacterium]|nr:FAD-dependent monooxygenase [Chloroflexota bacterium]
MNGQKNRRVIVVGGGIGGLTAALALQRAGCDVTVAEAADDVAHVWVGGGLHAWHNTMRALQEIGIAEEVEAAGHVVTCAEFATRSGRVLASWPVEDIARRVGAPTVDLGRGDLLRVLGGALAPGTVRTGLVFESYEQDDTDVTVRFANGQRVRCDVLIGADGIRSAVRRQLLGPIQPRAAGYGVWGGIVDFDRTLTQPGVFRLMYHRDNRIGYHRIGQDRLCWFATANVRPQDPDPARGHRAFLLETFHGWQEPVEAMIAATDEAVIRRRDMFALPPLKRWGEGRVTLLGDAAHAMTFDLGQGAGQAIEDAAVLARCLREGADVVGSLRAYEALRRPRAAGLQTASWWIGQINRWESRFMSAVRTQLVTFLLNGPVRAQHERNMAI